MKVFKPKELSLFPAPFGTMGNFYLGMGVMVFFDFDNPDAPLNEQDLWKTLPDQLGESFIIDQGIPKANGELLVTGACHAPKGESRPASEVAVSVGSLSKRLLVFGDRFWEEGNISAPVPFKKMPIDWKHAFGGENIKENPLGKGADKLEYPDGASRHPLPNVENPDAVIGAQWDSPSPAGFSQIDMMWPQRFSKRGTYGEQWLNERWPHFPDDLDYSFFNMAPADQQTKEFFTPGDRLEVLNMHPEKRAQQSHLPRIRIRAFITSDRKWSRHRFPPAPLPSEPLSETDEFREITMHPETVWLFPEIEKGLVIYRGATQIRDDEYADVGRAFLAMESSDDTPKSIEHYLEELKRSLNRSVEIDMTPFEQTQKKAAKVLKKFKSYKKDINEMRQKALGKRPNMPARSPEQFVEKSKQIIADNMSVLDRVEKSALELHAQFGHKAEIDLGIFNRMRTKAQAIGSQVEATAQKLSKVKAKLEAVKAEALKGASQSLKANLTPEQLAEAGIDPDDILKKEGKLGLWHDSGFPVVVEARRNIDLIPQTREHLKRLDFENNIIRRSWMGVTLGALPFTPLEWGLEQGQETTLPAGITIPGFDDKKLVSLIIFTPKEKRKFTFERFVVPGSQEDPLFRGAACLIDLPGDDSAESAPVIIAPDELQTLCVEQHAGDFCSVLALSAPDIQPGDEAAKEIKTTEAIVVILPKGFDPEEKNAEQWQKWLAVYPSALPLILEKGQNVFESGHNGEDIRERILEVLPEELAEGHGTSLNMPAKGKTPDKSPLDGIELPIPDFKSIQAGIFQEVKQALEAKFAPLHAMKSEAVQKMSAQLTDAGVDPTPHVAALMNPPAQKTDLAAETRKAAQHILDQKNELLKEGKINAEQAAHFDKQAQKISDLAAKTEQTTGKLQASLQAKKIEMKKGLAQLQAKEPPEEAKAKFAEYGMDPSSFRPLTRDDVVLRHERGETIKGAILTGLDLSGLDLSGLHFEGCQMKGADFSNCTLDNTRFEQCIGAETVFRNASLVSTTIARCTVDKADFANAVLKGAELHHSTFQKTLFEKADLSNAGLNMGIFNEACFKDADLTQSTIGMCILGKCDLTGVSFEKATLTKNMIKNSPLDGSSFKGATIHKTLFQTVTGTGIDFSNGNMAGIRFAKECDLPEIDFSNTDLSSSSLRDSRFHKGNFTSAIMDQSLIENCDLTQAKFYRAVARTTRFSKSNLEAADMKGLNLFAGSMRKARLVNTDLRYSNLYSTDFYKAVMGNTQLDEANIRKSMLENRLELIQQRDTEKPE